MSGGTAQQLRLRLFLEGVEIPIIGIQMQCQPNAPIAASIQIPPLAEGTKLMPRTLVHVFFYDFYEADNPLITRRGDLRQKGKKDPSVYQKSIQRAVGPNGIVDTNETDRLVPDYFNEKYKLLFVGEVIGFQWTKNVNTRSLVLQCQDPSNYWDYIKQYNNTDLFGPGQKAMFSGGSTNLFTDFLDEPGGVVSHLIQSPSTQYPALKGLLGGIVHLLEAVGGSYYYEKKYAGQNIFYSIAELRLHITQMITALEDDPTGQRLLNAGGFGDMLGRSLGGLGAEASFRDCINSLMKHIFHETYAIPSPLFVPGTAGTISGFIRKKLKDDPRYAQITGAAQSVMSSIEDIVASLVASAQPGADSQQRDAVLDRMKKLQKFCNDTASSTRKSNFPQVASYFSQAATEIGVVAGKVRFQWKPGAPKNVVSDLSERLKQTFAKMKQVEQLDQPQNTKKTAKPARLCQQIFRPDVWFSAPPCCNVIFPDMYTLAEYGREFLKEPTRLLLTTHDEFFGSDELFNNQYMAPKALQVKSSKRDLQSILSNDILDHELFTGILPVFEKMGELNIFGARSGTVKGKTPKIGLAQRSTNFMYFKYRFAARSMRVSCRFNPYIAPGFPGLVIDKQVDLETIRLQNQLRRKLGVSTIGPNSAIGTHFLGNVTQLEHLVTQGEGGSTQIAFGYPRQHDESVEFLGAIQDGQTVRKRFATDALRATTVAALSPPAAGSIGPNFGVITRVTDVTSQYKPNDDGVSSELPLYKGVRKRGLQGTVRVAVGVTQEARLYDISVVELVGGNGARLTTFRAYQIEEEVPRYRRVEVDLPAEEYIRPGWYGDIWHPSKIGGAYQQYFRTGSITDPQQVADPGGASTGTLDHDALDALAEAAGSIDADAPENEAPAILALDKDASVQQAVEFIVALYAYVKQSGAESDGLIREYTWRPIASMVDMFGSFDLELDEEGHEVIAGVEGFHSRAFGPYNDLFGLVTPDIESIVGIKRGTTVAQRADTRKRKQEAVKAYVTALQLGPAILG